MTRKKEINNWLCPNWMPSSEATKKAKKLAEAVKRAEMLEASKTPKFRYPGGYVKHPWDEWKSKNS